MISNVDAEIEESGSFTLPAKLLQEILGSVTVESGTKAIFELVNSESGEMEINIDRNKFNIQIQGTDGFPPVPALVGDDVQIFDIKCEGFAAALKEASVAMSSDEGNPVHKGICVDFSNAEKPVMVSTDSKRLAVTTVRDIEIPEVLRHTFVVPSKAVVEIQKLLDSNESIKFGLYKEQLLFSSEKFQFITRLVEGRFPDYNRVVPKDTAHTIKMNRKGLQQALKTVGPIARLVNNLVHFDVSANETKIWADAKESGRAESFVPSELEGETIQIGFNAKFIGDFLNVLEDEQVIIQLTTPQYPGLLRPGNPDSEFKYVVMPMTY